MSHTQPPDHLRTIAFVLAAVTVARLWVMPMANSFWLDETLTAWAVRGNFDRVFTVVGAAAQPQLFCVLEWPLSRLFGTSEVALRLLSLGAGLCTLYVYYRLGAEFLDSEAGALFSGLYMMLPQVTLEIPNARPYALALLAETAALLWLLRWLRSGKLVHGMAWILCTIISSYLHHLFLVVLPLELIFIVWHIWRGSPVKSRQLLQCGLAGTILLMPIFSQLRFILGEGNLLSYVGRPTWLALFSLFVPFWMVTALAAVLVLEQTAGVRTTWSAARAPHIAFLGAMLSFIPLSIFFALSRLTPLQLFNARYLMPSIPGEVLLWGWLMRGLSPKSVRYTSFAVALMESIFLMGQFSVTPDYRGENWRSAVRSIPESSAIMEYSGLVETRRLEWLQSPGHWEYLVAPVRAYRPTVTAQDTFVLPFDQNAVEQKYVEGLLSGPLHGRITITVIIRRSFSGTLWAPWIKQKLEHLNYLNQSETRYKEVEVAIYRLQPSAGH